MLALDNLRSIFHNIAAAPFIKAICGVTLLSFHWLFGVGDHNAILALYLLISFDTITGVIKSCIKNNLSSKKFFRVAIKSTVYFILLATAALIDKVLSIQLANEIMQGFLLITEAISILENISESGFPVPLFVLQILHVMQEEKANRPKHTHKKHHK